MTERARLGGFLEHMEWADALMWKSVHAVPAAFIESLDEAALAQVVEFPWADQIAQRHGAAGPATTRETFAQILE
jgi:hypothetical protein